MSFGHFDQLPVIALQLSVLVEKYRRATRAHLANKDDDASRMQALALLRQAGPLAFGVPALWPGWGDFVVRHSQLVVELANDKPAAKVAKAVRRLEDGGEILAQRCVAWAVRQPSGLAPRTASSFVEWDRARREAWEGARALEAAANAGVAPHHMEQMKRDLSERQATADHLFTVAELILHGLPAPTDAPVHADPFFEHERLIDEWRRATDEAAVAELSILELEVKKLPVTPAHRERVAELRKAARELRDAVYKASGL